MFSPPPHTPSIDASVMDRTSRASVVDRTSGASVVNRASGASAADDTSGASTGATSRFVRHYLEMVVVMFAGMYALMGPAGWLLGAVGTSWSGLSPAMNMFGMALTMTVPMVAWMRLRGHAWQPNMEMAASMLVPTFAVMALLSAGVASSGALMIPEHAGMLTCMLGVMLFRRDEYSCATHS
jgi:hypothetical protein